MVNLVYIYLTRIQFEYDKPIEIGGAGGAIYLPYLVPHHSTWSTQKARSLVYLILYSALRAQCHDPGAYIWPRFPLSLCKRLNPCNAESTFIEGTRTQKYSKTILTLSCWYSLYSSRWVLSDEHPFARGLVIFQHFSHHFLFIKLANSSTTVKGRTILFLLSLWPTSCCFPL